MVPIPQPSRLRTAAGAPTREYKSTGSAFFGQRRPLITYGKKDTKPLSLTASHFRRVRDPYSLPPEENEDHHPKDERSEESNVASAQAGARNLPEAAADDGDSDSGISDEPGRASPDASDGSQVHAQHRKTGMTAEKPIVLSSRFITSGETDRTAQTPPSKPRRQSDSLPAPKRVKHSPQGRSARDGPAAAPRRRLPVNELILVASPFDKPAFDPPQSNRPGIQTEDPINDLTSSAHKRDGSPIDSEDNAEDRRTFKKRPMSAFKNRLRSNKYRHKSIGDLRKKQSEQSPVALRPSVTNGDGFDDGELYISPLTRRTVRRRRPRQDGLISGFGALQLQSGPLPDVTFGPTSSPPKVEAKPRLCDGNEEMQAPRRLIGRVTSSSRARECDNAREAAIIAQLSSISAPALPRPEPGYGSNAGGDDEDDDLDEDIEEDEETEVDEDQIAKGFQAVADDDVYEADTEIEEAPNDQFGEKSAISKDKGLDHGSVVSDVRDGTVVSQGVSLDFRRHVPGQRPRRRRIRQESLMEVDENIMEVPDFDEIFLRSAHSPTDTHFREPNFATPPSAQVQPPRSPTKRPRSILKNASQAVLDSTTQAEHTAANTRRNSTIGLSESRYFTDAANMLRHMDPTKHKIVPRRRSSYFNDDVEMLDSGAVVPETSLSPEPEVEMLDYASASGLSVLKRASEAEWTSQSLPAAPRDLATLTRSVSRGHGTLSQSMRRRPSLPFQSPTKIR